MSILTEFILITESGAADLGRIFLLSTIKNYFRHGHNGSKKFTVLGRQSAAYITEDITKK